MCMCVCVCVVACYPGSLRCVADGSCVSSYYYCNRRCNCPLCTDELHCYMPRDPRITITPTHSTTTTTWYPPPVYTTDSRYPYYTTTTGRYPPSSTSPQHLPGVPYITTTSGYLPGKSFSMLPPYILHTIQ